MMKPRSLFTRLVLATVPALAACATDPAEPMPEDPSPEDPSPEQPMPEQPTPTPLASGALDPAFGTGGIQPLDLGAAYASALAVQGDKLIACATVIDGAAWVARVYRFDATGALDTSFGGQGRTTISAAGNVACRDVVALPDGKISVLYRTLANGMSQTAWLSSDGTPMPGATPSESKLSTKLDVTSWGGEWAVTYGYVSDSFLSLGYFTPASGDGEIAIMIADSVVRVFRPSPIDVSAVARITDNDVTTWQIVHRTPDGIVTLGANARAAAGTDAPDILADALQLPDGSWFAVGGVDTGLEVMAARFVAGASSEAFVEHHAPGGPASASAVVLDGADRPIVVGKATDAGKTVFAWQRYQASSVTLDPGYQVGGIATVAAPSGHGELVDVVRLNGALYALGSYDVETASPKVALVKIAE